MKIIQQGGRFGRAALVVGALALGGCVSDAYLYDDDPGVYYRGSAGYSPNFFYGDPGHYGYPRYYAPPGYYGYSPYPPGVVHYDHDHRGDDCRHPSHRDGRRDDDRDRHDRNDRDRQPQDRDGRPDRRPPDEGPATPAARPATNEPGAAPNERRPPAESRPDEPRRGMRALRRQQPADPGQKSEARKELE